MSAELYTNSPVKSCKTCVHCHHESHGASFNKCARYGYNYCFDAIGACKWNDWMALPPKPEPRSLRQWLYDTFWKKTEL